MHTGSNKLIARTCTGVCACVLGVLLMGCDRHPTDLAYSHDGKYFAAAGEQHVCVWATETWAVVDCKKIPGNSAINPVAWPSGSETLAVAADSVKRMKVAPNREFEAFDPNVDIVYTLVSSHDGHYLASSSPLSGYLTTRIWDSASGRLLATYDYKVWRFGNALTFPTNFSLSMRCWHMGACIFEQRTIARRRYG
jgi:WD40 repeat protein